MSFLGDLGSGLVGAANSIYNLFTNKRDFDYQKALQQTMFEREDTAVQRRMSDLQAAGLNPNLAAGSAAGAGAVVSRSSTNDVNMGSALDTLQAVNNIKQQKQSVLAAKKQNQILDEKLFQEEQNSLEKKFSTELSLASIMYQMGLPVEIVTDHDGNGNFTPGVRLNYEYDKPGRLHWNTEKPFEKLLDYQIQNTKNSADMLQKELDFFDANEIGKILGGIIRLLK